MDRLITNTDFKNPMKVYFQDGKKTQTYLNDIIDRYQKKILLDILGYELYYNFEDQYPDGGFWDEFVDGKDYTNNGINYEYEGIKDVLVGMIFYYYEKSQKTKRASEDRIISKFNESIKYMPAELVVESWNDAVDLIESRIENKPTVYNFIDHNYTGSIEWVYTREEKINMFI
jgi:hypothetical protein